MCLILGSTSLISTALTYAEQKVSFANSFTIFSISIFFFLFYLYFRKAKRIEFGTHFFILSYFLMITTRMIQGNGILSPNVFVYTLFCICVFVIYGNGLGFLGIFCSTLVSGTVFFIQLNYPSILPINDIPLFVQGIFMLLAFLYAVFPLKFIIDEKEALSKKLREYEKKEAVHTLLKRLNHELGNGLYIAIGEIEMAEMKNISPDLNRISNKLHEMNDIVKFLSEIADSEDLVAFLKQHEKDIKIMNSGTIQ